MTIPSNIESIVCSCQSVFWCFASCDRKKQPPKEVNNTFKHFSNHSKIPVRVSTYQLNPLCDSFSFFRDTFSFGLFWHKWIFFATYFEEQFKPQILLGYHKKHMSVYLKCLNYHIFIVFLYLMLKICKYTQKYMKIWKKINSCKTYFPYLN